MFVEEQAEAAVNILVARCPGPDAHASRHEDKVCRVLEKAGFRVQTLHLPMQQPDAILRSIASCRLLPIKGVADALLCLDLYSAVLKHPRKLVWIPVGAEAIEPKPGTSLIDNILRAGLAEASVLFASAAQAKQLRTAGLGVAKILEVAFTDLGQAATLGGKPANRWEPLLAELQR